jgi:PPOX class probable F420-dependent enzyme
MSVTMTREEREQFLAGVHVGVLSVASPDGGGPLAVPVWYSYQPGGTLDVITGAGTRKAAAIRAAGRFSLCAQDENPPYKYVTVEGAVSAEEQASHQERLDLARRYLGSEGGNDYVSANPTGGQIVFRMTPERWLTVDQGKAYS